MDGVAAACKRRGDSRVGAAASIGPPGGVSAPKHACCGGRLTTLAQSRLAAHWRPKTESVAALKGGGAESGAQEEEHSEDRRRSAAQVEKQQEEQQAEGRKEGGAEERRSGRTWEDKRRGGAGGAKRCSIRGHGGSQGGKIVY